MSARPWQFYLQLHPAIGIPNIVRFALAILSGAVLSLSYRGTHWSLYSWFCIAVLLITILRSKAWVAFLCGFLHGLIFVVTSVSYTHLRAHETDSYLVCRLLLEKKKK